MSKKSIKTLVSITLSLVFTTALSGGSVKALEYKRTVENTKYEIDSKVAVGIWSDVKRTGGVTRYETASRVAIENWKSGSDNVVLVSGEGYADGLSASTLAKKLGAPILLTTPNTLSKDAENALDVLKPKNIYVIGGTASVSKSVRDSLKNKYAVIELGGDTRYETNVKVANKLVELGVSSSNVLVVSGEGFSDAISAAPVAAAKGEILLLANNNESSVKKVIDFVKENKSKVTVIGTGQVINDNIYNALGATKRIDGGYDRFKTNLKILEEFRDSFDYNKIYVAATPAPVANTAEYPDNLYADALIASAVASKYSAPLVLVDRDCCSATDHAIDYIKANASKSSLVELVGGYGVISRFLEKKIH